MPDFKEMYLTLFSAMTDAIEMFQKCQPLEAVALLKTAQQKTEEMYIEREKRL